MWRSWPSRSGTNSWFPASDHRAGPTVDATSRSQPSDSSRAERAGRRIPDSFGFGGRGGCPDAETRGTVGLYGGSLRGSHFSGQSKWMGRPRTAPPTRPRSSRTVGGVPSRVGRPLAHCGNRAPTLSEAAVRSISSSSTSPHRGKRTSAPSMDRLKYWQLRKKRKVRSLTQCHDLVKSLMGASSQVYDRLAILKLSKFLKLVRMMEEEEEEEEEETTAHHFSTGAVDDKFPLHLGTSI
ncbi:hypothetical protein GW17_00009202 [Ensete ventricosum]|nr:hypothetical protein GW17_00009202 [Ensete ventricosum]